MVLGLTETDDGRGEVISRSFRPTDADGLVGDYRVRVDESQMWTVKAVRRRGVRQPNDRLVIRNGEILDDLGIAIVPR